MATSKDTFPLDAEGMTVDEVVAILGQRVAKVDLGGQGLVFVYNDMKITFVDGKVSNIE
jgi:hypothetical protein